MPILPPLDILARGPLLPVMIWQGLRLRRTALVLPEAPGPREGRIGNGPALRVLIVGDSSAAGVGAGHQDAALSGQLVRALAPSYEVSWRLIARTGATTAATLTSVRQITPEPFDVALIALGVNDAVRLVPRRRWRRQQKALRALLRDSFGVKHLVVTEVPPLKDFPALTPLLRWIIGAHAMRLAEDLRADLGQEQDTQLLQFDMHLTPDAMAEDGYHPNEASYALWAQAAQRCISKAFDSKGAEPKKSESWRKSDSK